MVLTEADITKKQRLAKVPQTFNPLGGIIGGLTLGEGTALIYLSLISKEMAAGASVIGIILVLITIFLTIFAYTQSAKSILFYFILEKKDSFGKPLLIQGGLFYLGFTPFFGFMLAYGVSTISFWKFFIPIIVMTAGFAISVRYNIIILENENARIGNLLELKYQPKKILMVSSIVSVISVLISLLSILFIPN